MSDPDAQDQSPTTPHPSEPQQSERAPAPQPDQDSRGEDQYFLIAEKLVGTAMMFIGFIDILISISSGSELGGVFPVIFYFAGLAIWGHATIINPTIRYLVIGFAIVMALVFFHLGEVLFWHKQALFWGSVLLVMFFMFKGSPK